MSLAPAAPDAPVYELHFFSTFFSCFGENADRGRGLPPQRAPWHGRLPASRAKKTYCFDNVHITSEGCNEEYGIVKFFALLALRVGHG